MVPSVYKSAYLCEERKTLRVYSKPSESTKDEGLLSSSKHRSPWEKKSYVQAWEITNLRKKFYCNIDDSFWCWNCSEIDLEFKLSFDWNMRGRFERSQWLETCIFALIRIIRARHVMSEQQILFVGRWISLPSLSCVASSADRKENDQTDVEMRSPAMFKGRMFSIPG